MNDQERIEQILKGHHPCVLINTFEEALARKLVTQAAMNTNKELYVWSVTEGLRQGVMANEPPIQGTEHPAAAMYYLTRKDGDFTVIAIDMLEHLNDSRTVRAVRDLIEKFEVMHRSIFMIDYNNELPKPLIPYTTHFDLSLPDAAELEYIIKTTLKNFNSQEYPIQIDITRKGLNTIIRNLKGLTRRQAEQIIINTVAEDHRFDHDDINTILAQKRQLLHSGGLLEYIEAPAELNEIGGLRTLKNWLKQRHSALTDDAVNFGLVAPRGVMMLGIQGAGKSLCAKAIATAWQLPLLRMDTGALYDRYIGESERRLRMSLHQAEMMAPIVLWIDEIEKAFASAASRSSDGGLSQRMFGTLLTWMQEHQEPVFLVATANDIEALPPELLRKGRFDEIFFVDLPEKDTREKIFEIHLRKRNRKPEQFDLKLLAKESHGFSGAEIEQAVISGLHEAYAKKTEINTEMVLQVLKNSPPLSVTMAERIKDLREWAKYRCVPAD